MATKPDTNVLNDSTNSINSKDTREPLEPPDSESRNHFTLSTSSLRLDTASDIQPHIQPLVNSTTITSIHLGGNTLGAPACAHLAPHLSSQSRLHTANLADIFTSRLLSEIPPALSSLLTACLKLPNLHIIDLSDNAFGLNTQAPLVEFLKEHVPLKCLILNNNGLGPEAGAKIADALTELAKRKEEARKEGRDVPNLETIVCGRNRLESGSMKAWVRAFQAHTHIKEVRMTQNGIRQEGISLLLRDGLKSCQELEVLDLQDNTFTLSGAQALSSVVGGWASLRELGVGDCLLGARGTVVVAEALGKGENKHLRTFRAQYNDIDAKGAKALFVATEKGGLEGLRRVELNGNKFSEDDEGVEGLRTLLEKRREDAGVDDAGGGEWGMDELSDLEEESEDEDEGGDDGEDEDDEEKEEEREEILKDADEEEAKEVPQEKDADVDELAERLGKEL